MTTTAKERNNLSMMLRQRTRLRLKTPHPIFGRKAESCTLLQKTRSESFENGLDLTLQLRYLHWIVKSTLHVYNQNEVNISTFKMWLIFDDIDRNQSLIKNDFVN